MIHWENQKTKCRNQKIIIRIYFYIPSLLQISRTSLDSEHERCWSWFWFWCCCRWYCEWGWMLSINKSGSWHKIYEYYVTNWTIRNIIIDLNWNSDVIDLIDVQWLIHTSSTIKVNVVVNDNASIQNAKKERKLMWSIYNPPQWVVNFHIIKEMLTSRVCIITEKSENKSNPIVCYSV